MNVPRYISLTSITITIRTGSKLDENGCKKSEIIVKVELKDEECETSTGRPT